MKTGIHQLDQYDYELPERLIAQQPTSPRDRAKLLVLDRTTGEVSTDTFQHLPTCLPGGTVLVFNQTKVMPARMAAKKETGGKIELLILAWHGKEVTVITNRRVLIGQTILVGKHRLTVIKQRESEFILRMNFSPRQFLTILNRSGATPIPPYIKHTRLSEAKLRKEYQTVFAKKLGSAAAPTASLHFTRGLLSKLRQHGYAIEFVTLHVGLGTFAPLTRENLTTGRLHQETYEISQTAAARLNRYKAQRRPIIAVGTTVARTLESAAELSSGRLIPGQRETSIFIRPGYRWKFVDGLITNFHVPRSSLLMLVAALVGRQRLFALYQFAIQKKFRFFSFGDGMLIR